MSIRSMKSAINNYVSTSIYKATENMKAKRGIIRGSNVVIGNKVLPYVPAVDMYFEDGSEVWCIPADSGYSAVVVGV